MAKEPGRQDEKQDKEEEKSLNNLRKEELDIGKISKHLKGLHLYEAPSPQKID